MISMRRFASRAAANGGVLARVPRKALVDAAQLGCALVLFASPFWLAFPPAAAWNLWIAGYAMLTFSVAALVAEAEWEPRANLTLGLWLMAAPGILAFSDHTAATLVHLAGGTAACVLSAVELWHAEETPPGRFGPAAARRPDLISVVSATAPLACHRPMARAGGTDRQRAKCSPRPHAERRACVPRRHASRRTRVARPVQLGAPQASGRSFESLLIATR